MKTKYWLAIVAALVVAHCVGAMIAKWANDSLVRPHVIVELRNRFDEPARQWHKILHNDQRSFSERLESLREQHPFEIHAATIDPMEMSESVGIPDVYYLIPDDGGVVIAVVVDAERVVEFGPVPGTFWYIYADTLVAVAIHTLMALLVLSGAYMLYSMRLRRLLAYGDKKIGPLVVDGMPFEEPSAVLDRFCSDFERMVDVLFGMRKDTSRSIDNQRDFLHGVAHEFRAPLARLRFALDISGPQRDATIEQVVEDMDDLVTEILQYSRYRHGLFEVKAETVKISELLRLTAQEITSNSQVELLLGSGIDSNIQCVTDANLIRRCLTNVLLNAVRFARKSVYVDVVRVNGSLLELVVEDDGLGIPPGKRKLIFEPFTRLDPSRNRNSGGTGLGLSIVLDILNKLSGTVGVGEAVVLTGARVWMRLPYQSTVPGDY
ncbi:MAG: ATP-binding protein [Porticoccaceae bacterium]|nr:ATP-binding protein [Porticoccaceae bacterium]